MTDAPQTTDVTVLLRRELAHPVMKASGSGEVEGALLQSAVYEIERLRREIKLLKQMQELFAP